MGHTPNPDFVPTTVKVYTFDFDLDKNFQGVEGDDASKYSATFKLEDAEGNRISFVQTGTKYEKADSDDTATVDEITINGTDVINVVGLAAGTYTLTELTTADGYNLLTDPITVTITDTTQDGAENPSHTVTYVIGDGEEAEGTVTVLNQSGSILPSTGGIGTTIFYVVGALLVIGAGVVMVTRRRMDAQ